MNLPRQIPVKLLDFKGRKKWVIKQKEQLLLENNIISLSNSNNARRKWSKIFRIPNDRKYKPKI